jgi:hypothetical protein
MGPNWNELWSWQFQNENGTFNWFEPAGRFWDAISPRKRAKVCVLWRIHTHVRVGLAHQGHTSKRSSERSGCQRKDDFVPKIRDF